MKSKAQILTIVAVILIIGFVLVYAQMQGFGGGGRCPMCGRQWDGRGYYAPAIPENLPRPSNEQWLQRFSQVMAKERLSKAQYSKDERKFNIQMPYAMVIPQEENHIEWIARLYSAFGMQAPDSVPALIETSSGRDALQVAMNLEKQLVPNYEWLIKNAENDEVKRIINDILYQTRMHYTMFQHAMYMGGLM